MMFDDLFSALYNERDFMTRSRLEERDGKYIVTVDVPGIPKEDLEVETKNKILYVKAPKYSLDYRYVYLPDRVDFGTAEASCKDGRLVVTFKIKDSHTSKKLVIT